MKIKRKIKLKNPQPKNKPWLVWELGEEIRPQCKTCNKNDRRLGSAYCGECSINYHSGL